MLEHFARRPGRALTRNDILDAVWGRAVIVTARSVDRCVATLRSKIEPDPHRPTYIQTIRDIGYRFEPEAQPGTGGAVRIGRDRRSRLPPAGEGQGVRGRGFERDESQTPPPVGRSCALTRPLRGHPLPVSGRGKLCG